MSSIFHNGKKKIPIAVVIPSYRCNATIIRSLDSILNQTVLPQEVFIIDDNANKDETEHLFLLIKKYIPNLNIKFISNLKNFGAPYARNLGWNLAKSDYVAFLDSDDAWHPQKLELQYAFMQKNLDIVLTGHDIEIVKSEKKEFHEKYNSTFLKSCSKKNILFRNIFPTPTLMIKRDVYYRFDETMRYVDDHLFLMNIILDNNRAVKLGNKLAYVFKPMFGASGLSSNMYQMEKHELLAYSKIFRAKKINFLTYIFVIIFSFLKYIRRLILLRLQ